ncbi:MAG: hypothetical protein V4735_09855 [Pseudomonadota bacterium]
MSNDTAQELALLAGQAAAPRAQNPDDEHSKQKLKIANAVAAIRASNLLPDEQAKLIASVESGQGGALDTILANVSAQTKQETVKQSTNTVALYTFNTETYPDYASYSAPSQQYIGRQIEFAHKHSETFRKLEAEYKALPAIYREEGDKQAAKNWQELAALSADPEMAEKYKEELAIMRRLKIANMPDAAHLLQMMRDGKDPAEIHKGLDKVIDEQAKVIGGVMSDIMPGINQASQAYLKEHYGNPPDARAMLDDWSKISLRDRDAIYQVLNGADPSKLTPEQLKLVPQVQHMSAVMIAADGAQTMYAGIAMAKDKEFEAKLLDTNIPVAVRGEMVESYMRTHGYATLDKDARDRFARELVQTLDKHPEAIEYIRNGQIDKVGALYQSEVLESSQSSGKANDLNASAMSFIVASRQDAANEAIPRYIKDDPERFAAYQQQTTQWQGFQAVYSPDVLESLLNPPKPEATAALEAVKLPDQATLRKMDNAAAEASAKGSETAVVAAAVVSPPPGINPEKIPSLAAVGVTGGQSASSSTPAVQLAQLAKAPTADDLYHS